MSRARHRRRGGGEGFSLSFLDCICCAFGAIILLFVLSKFGEPIVIEQTRSDLKRRLLDDAMAKLPEREREIIRLRHCVDEPMTLRQVGRAMKMSRERVRQLEAQALRKLRNIVRPKYERAEAPTLRVVKTA